MRRQMYLFLDLCKQNLASQFIMMAIIMLTTYLCLLSVNCIKQYTDYTAVLEKNIDSRYVTYGNLYHDDYDNDLHGLLSNEFVDDVSYVSMESVMVGASRVFDSVVYEDWFEVCSDYKLKGRLPVNQNEIVIDESSKDVFSIGDELNGEMATGDGRRVNVTLKIVGFINIYNTIDPNEGGGVVCHTVNSKFSLISNNIIDDYGNRFSGIEPLIGAVKIKDNVDYRNAIESIKLNVRHPAYVSDYYETYEDYITNNHHELVILLSFFAVSISLMFIVIVAKNVFMFYSQKRSLYIKHLLGTGIVELTRINLMYELLISLMGFVLGNVMYLNNETIIEDFMFLEFKIEYKPFVVIITFLIVMGLTLAASIPYYVKMKSDEMIFE